MGTEWFVFAVARGVRVGRSHSSSTYKQGAFWLDLGKQIRDTSVARSIETGRTRARDVQEYLEQEVLNAGSYWKAQQYFEGFSTFSNNLSTRAVFPPLV